MCHHTGRAQVRGPNLSRLCWNSHDGWTSWMLSDSVLHRLLQRRDAQVSNMP
uniref:Uncharacterized protein n=1 Tax=Mesocestoides corti TaxID=53468 RepID=A0A5K3F914_MESCO